MPDDPNDWLLLIHRLPTRNPYLRVKVWRRLQRVGAVAVQNAAYVLPNSDACREHFEWIVREVKQHGGIGSVLEARFVDGIGDDEIRAEFVDARGRDYQAIAEEAEKLLSTPEVRPGREHQPVGFVAAVERLRRRKDEILAIDYFPGTGSDEAERLIARLETLTRPSSPSPVEPQAPRWALGDVQGRTWVTRKGVHVDRIASAWLIREYIDPAARFKFVPARGYEPGARELRFDMYDAEFTHDGDLCTFEVMLRDFALSGASLNAIAEIVHAIDLKVEEPLRPETIGIAHALEGIARRHAGDDERLHDGAALFAALDAYYRNKLG